MRFDPTTILQTPVTYLVSLPTRFQISLNSLLLILNKLVRYTFFFIRTVRRVGRGGAMGANAPPPPPHGPKRPAWKDPKINLRTPKMNLLF